MCFRCLYKKIKKLDPNWCLVILTFFIAVGALTTMIYQMQANQLLNEDIQARNRPYLEIVPVMNFLDSDGNSIGNDQELVKNIATIEPYFAIKNHGEIPAEILNMQASVLNTNISQVDGESIVFPNGYVPVTGPTFDLDEPETAFFENKISYFAKVKYAAIPNSKEYILTTKVDCYFKILNGLGTWTCDSAEISMT